MNKKILLKSLCLFFILCFLSSCNLNHTKSNSLLANAEKTKETTDNINEEKSKDDDKNLNTTSSCNGCCNNCCNNETKIDTTKDNSEKKIIGMSIDEIWTRDGKKKVFLTFDDGPSENTPKILDILEKHDVKATFFILGQSLENYPEYFKKEIEKGHSIGNHTYSHNIQYFGSFSPEKFVEDVKKADRKIKEVAQGDFSTNLVRFPGGSFEHEAYKKALNDAGFKDIDWNIDSTDSKSLQITSDEIITHIKTDFDKYDFQHVVLLMHDSSTKKNTVEALPKIIEFFKDKGFEFDVISQKQ